MCPDKSGNQMFHHPTFGSPTCYKEITPGAFAKNSLLIVTHRINNQKINRKINGASA